MGKVPGSLPHYNLQNVNSGMYLNVEGNSKDSGVNVWQYDTPPTYTSSQWYLDPVVSPLAEAEAEPLVSDAPVALQDKSQMGPPNCSIAPEAAAELSLLDSKVPLSEDTPEAAEVKEDAEDDRGIDINVGGSVGIGCCRLGCWL